MSVVVAAEQMTEAEVNVLTGFVLFLCLVGVLGGLLAPWYRGRRRMTRRFKSTSRGLHFAGEKRGLSTRRPALSAHGGGGSSARPAPTISAHRPDHTRPVVDRYGLASARQATARVGSSAGPARVHLDRLGRNERILPPARATEAVGDTSVTAQSPLRRAEARAQRGTVTATGTGVETRGNPADVGRGRSVTPSVPAPTSTDQDVSIEASGASASPGRLRRFDPDAAGPALPPPVGRRTQPPPPPAATGAEDGGPGHPTPYTQTPDHRLRRGGRVSRPQGA
jgi:hypothetical protein